MAALNAALNASLPSDVAGSHPELADAAAGTGSGNDATDGAEGSSAASTAGNDKVHVKDAIAQLQRSLDVDVAMLTNWATAAEAAVDSSNSNSDDDGSSSGLQDAGMPDDEVTHNLSTEDLAASAAAFEADTAAAAAAVEPPAVDPITDEAVAEAAADAAESSASSVDNNGPVSFPKGWGPRADVGFEGFDQTCNNIVSLKKLAGKAVPAGDAAAAVAAQQQAADQA